MAELALFSQATNRYADLLGEHHAGEIGLGRLGRLGSRGQMWFAERPAAAAARAGRSAELHQAAARTALRLAVRREIGLHEVFLDGAGCGAHVGERGNVSETIQKSTRRMNLCGHSSGGCGTLSFQAVLEEENEMNRIVDMTSIDAGYEEECDDLLYMDLCEADFDDTPLSDEEVAEFLDALARGENPAPLNQECEEEIAVADARFAGMSLEEIDRYWMRSTRTAFDTLPEMDIILENLYVM